MSKKSGSQRRLEFFDRGNRACPICLKEFSRGGVEAGQNVTLEHAPPKAIGGSVACLTCDSCNRRASGSVDIAVALHQKAIENQKTGRGTQIEIDVFGTKHTTFMSTPNAPTSNPTKWLQQHDNAEQLRKQLANKEVLIFAELTRGPNWDPQKGITITQKRPLDKHVLIGHLRTAYLLVFAFLGVAGYRYAESPALLKIREQIMNQDEIIIESLLCQIAPADSSVRIMINNVSFPFCWVVKIGRFAVLLPPGGGPEYFENVQNAPENLQASNLPWCIPTAFGKGRSFDLCLPVDSPHMGKNLFGQVVAGPKEWSDLGLSLMVVNQDGACSTLRVVSRNKPPSAER